MELHLNTNDINFIHWWANVSYSVQSNLKVHTSATMSLCKVFLLASPRNIKAIPPDPPRFNLSGCMTPCHR